MKMFKLLFTDGEQIKSLYGSELTSDEDFYYLVARDGVKFSINKKNIISVREDNRGNYRW